MSTEPAAEPSLIFRLVPWLAVFAVPALLATRPLVEYDTGWHLRTGQWIVEHRAIPWQDPFTTAPADQVWIAYSWLFGLMLFGLHQVFGFAGIWLYRTLLDLLIVTALCQFLGRRIRNPLLIAGLALLGTMGLGRMLVAERPGLLSILFSLASLDSVLSLREGRGDRRVWLLPF